MGKARNLAEAAIFAIEDQANVDPNSYNDESSVASDQGDVQLDDVVKDLTMEMYCLQNLSPTYDEPI